MVKKSVMLSMLCCIAQQSIAQTTYLPLNTDEYHLIDRLETFNGKLINDFYTSWKPIPRKNAVLYLVEQKRNATFQNANIGNLDYYNLERAISISGEWTETAEGDDGALQSKRPILKYFYQKQANLVHVHTDDFFVAINPVIYAQGMYERGQDGLRYINTRGAEVRGKIKNRIGFYSLLADNQEKTLTYVQQWTDVHQAYPGNDYYLNPKAGLYDIFMARGYVDVNAWKDRINITFGYDKNFTGDGLRSLLLSDFGAPATFLRMRSQFGQFMYQNLFMELTADYTRGGDRRLPRKYLSMHQLGTNVNRWLHLGIFETTVYGRGDKFSIANVIPVIGYNTVARALGANQKTSWGLNFKAIALHRFQLYGQAHIDQLDLGNLTTGSWKNQWGVQLGAKYFNAFSVKNLDLQAEGNVVRPFTYAAVDSVSNFSQYNQPLAHPFESSFIELIGVAKYQPAAKWLVTGKGIYAKRGYDSTANLNLGNNLFKPIATRSQNEVALLGNSAITSIYLNLNIAYELRPNIFLEAGGVHLRRQTEQTVAPNVTYIYGGLRWNIARKEYDYY